MSLASEFASLSGASLPKARLRSSSSGTPLISLTQARRASCPATPLASSSQGSSHGGTGRPIHPASLSLPLLSLTITCAIISASSRFRHSMQCQRSRCRPCQKPLLRVREGGECPGDGRPGPPPGDVPLRLLAADQSRLRLVWNPRLFCHVGLRPKGAFGFFPDHIAAPGRAKRRAPCVTTCRVPVKRWGGGPRTVRHPFVCRALASRPSATQDLTRERARLETEASHSKD